jgi:Ca-activated chloride channel family protein
MRALAILTALALSGAVALGGTAPLGRVLLAAGAPGLAALVLDDPGWRGVALYRAENFDRAEEAFRQADQPFNLGNALAHAGRYAAALEAYDRAVVLGDPDARANFDVVAAYYAGLGIDAETLALFRRREEGPQADSSIAQGDARAAGTGSEVTNANTMLGLAELDSRGQLGVRRVFDDTFIVADDRWIAQLSDVPGAYMAARIAQERKRRAELGLAPPEPEDPQ